MGVYERLNKIEEFFKNLSIEEFEEILIYSGINRIKPASDFNMEMFLKVKGDSYTTNGIYNKGKNDVYNEFESNMILTGAA